MAELKTKRNDASVEDFLGGIADERRRREAFTILDLMRNATGLEPKMWGDSIVGFGEYHYKSRSGCEGDWFVTGFSPRKQNLTLYIMPGFESYGALLEKLGKHKTGVSCLYINRLADVDLPTLKELIRQSVEHMGRIHRAELDGQTPGTEYGGA
jgi:hypothetical protein